MQEIEICLNGYTLIVEAHVNYQFTPGRPARPPSYASGGDPPEGPEISISSTKLTRETGEVLECDWLAEFVETSLHDDPDALIEDASDDRVAEADEAADFKRQQIRDDRKET